MIKLARGHIRTESHDQQHNSSPEMIPPPFLSPLIHTPYPFLALHSTSATLSVTLSFSIPLVLSVAMSIPMQILFLICTPVKCRRRPPIPPHQINCYSWVLEQIHGCSTYIEAKRRTITAE
ncbi:hypothetical protein EVAR_78560_1 [Eumeta japonica]|uniref:Uncharacterized protein n=1 Tax=Eumeta variegata TaxID=151549 RepID=A0A4C1W672_EUMVA|nr:hypothetical protein EVAR_78560_1 [Eumeta japonica]